MDVIRSIQISQERPKVDRIVFLPPSSHDLGDTPSPYAEAARSHDDTPLTWQWKVAKYQESIKATSRQTYIAQQKLQSQASRPIGRFTEAIVSAKQTLDRDNVITAISAQEKSATILVHQKARIDSFSNTISLQEHIHDDSSHSALEDVLQTASKDKDAIPEKVSESAESSRTEVPIEPNDNRKDTISKETRAKSLPHSKLALGPARRVGISKKSSTTRPVFLKDLEESRRNAKELVKGKSINRIANNEGDSQCDDTISIAAPTTVTNVAETTAGFESIAPPPSYRFTLAGLTSIASLLNENENLSPAQHSDNLHLQQRLISVLAIIRRVGQLEYVRDWKGGYGKQMARCEVVIQDGQGYTLKLVLQGICADTWAGFHDVTDRSASSNTADDQSGYLDSRSYFDFDKGFDASSMLAKREDLRLMPIQEGDVVHLDRIRVLKRSNQQTKRFQTRQVGSDDVVEQDSTNIYTVASESHRSTLEICWRSTGHIYKTFDAHLPYIDGRCDAIYKLHQSWQSFQ